MASRNAPSLNRPISPVVDRVPSGKIITETLRSSHTLHWFIAVLALDFSPLVSGTSPARRSSQPTIGILNSSFLVSHFISNGMWAIRRMSTKDSWLATITYGLRGSAGISPVTRSATSGSGADG